MSLHPTNVILMPPLPEMGAFSASPSSPDSASRSSSSSSNTKKRRRLSPTKDSNSTNNNEELICVLTGATPAPPRPRAANGAPLTATHEIRLLRAQVAEMEDELRALNNKWAAQLPDQRTLAIAQRSAREKHGAIQTEAAHNELQQMLLQQQLLFATLQAAVLRAPLHSSGQAMFEALHFDTHLGRDAEERETLLLAHNERSLATLPSIVNRFAQMAIDRVVAHQGKSKKPVLPVLPLSHLDITGCKNRTLISSVFISEIPHTSLEQVYAAVLAYFDGIPTSMKRHFNVNAKRTRLNSADSPVVYRRSTFNGAGLPAIVNNVVCSDLTPSHGMVHIDAITEDPLHPVNRTGPSQYGICGLTITPRKDPVTGRTVAVTLRWAVVYNYNMLPDDPALKDDLEIIRPILNGDLITATVCGYIQQQQQQQSQSPRTE
ncbi:hypothetical protein PHYSODRAFT_336516 [Phytophthora sojae]|uniref:START domain-containing protein n=1 Tax=Phytophthora sojae (strain P6497) TaxID=1094619 RepID=G4ZYL1_PHYSP|nr:hypothetical protein PHYSODRAFT_336516 [Phytophthora sojae]EGZ12044.1 hypothetical protein PHYSODRAFT_336516 [Phytophthora sojae]|eukprot:XP_009532377.1 hypothetical protein PHYSODRAFT_336516 [Phytophthora sojae]